MDAYNNVGIDSIETAKNLKKLRIENNLKLKQVRDAIGLFGQSRRYAVGRAKHIRNFQALIMR